MTTYDEDDLFELTEREFCDKYGITKAEYDEINKDFQEM